LGLGSLGSHVAEEVCKKCDENKEVLLIDFDKVEEENLELSNYEESDIGQYKSDSLLERIIEATQKSASKISHVNSRFPDLKFNKNDFVIDCRDNFNDTIDEQCQSVKISILSDGLCIDAYKHDDRIVSSGKYNSSVKKEDVSCAAKSFMKFTEDKRFVECLQKNEIVILKNSTGKIVQKILPEELSFFDGNILNFKINFPRIQDVLKDNNVQVVYSNDVNKYKISFIEKGHIKEHDLYKRLTEEIKSTGQFDENSLYIITFYLGVINIVPYTSSA
jgi:hypothetical protein